MAHSAGLFPIDLFTTWAAISPEYSPTNGCIAPTQPGSSTCARIDLDNLNVRYAGGRAEAWLDFDAQTYGAP